jgi:hypothetical protein
MMGTGTRSGSKTPKPQVAEMERKTAMLCGAVSQMCGGVAIERIDFAAIDETTDDVRGALIGLHDILRGGAFGDDSGLTEAEVDSVYDDFYSLLKRAFVIFHDDGVPTSMRLRRRTDMQ